MAHDIDDEEDDREALQQELAMHRERLVEAHENPLKLLPYWEGHPDEEREIFSPPLDVLLCQRAVSEAETEPRPRPYRRLGHLRHHRMLEFR